VRVVSQRRGFFSRALFTGPPRMSGPVACPGAPGRSGRPVGRREVVLGAATGLYVVSARKRPRPRGGAPRSLRDRSSPPPITSGGYCNRRPQICGWRIRSHRIRFGKNPRRIGGSPLSDDCAPVPWPWNIRELDSGLEAATHPLESDGWCERLVPANSGCKVAQGRPDDEPVSSGQDVQDQSRCEVPDVSIESRPCRTP
jgi:hypothetical protein